MIIKLKVMTNEDDPDESYGEGELFAIDSTKIVALATSPTKRKDRANMKIDVYITPDNTVGIAIGDTDEAQFQ